MAGIEAKAALPGVTKKASTVAAAATRTRDWRDTTHSPSSCARKASPSGLRKAPSPSALRDAAGLGSCSSTGRVDGMANRDGELFEFNVFAATLEPFAQARVHQVEHAHHRRPGEMHVPDHHAARRRAEGGRVTDKHVGARDAQGGRRSRIGRVWTFAKDAGFSWLLRPRSLPDQGQGRVVQPLPVQARGLSGRLRRVG